MAYVVLVLGVRPAQIYIFLEDWGKKQFQLSCTHGNHMHSAVLCAMDCFTPYTLSSTTALSIGNFYSLLHPPYSPPTPSVTTGLQEESLIWPRNSPSYPHPKNIKANWVWLWRANTWPQRTQNSPCSTRRGSSSLIERTTVLQDHTIKCGLTVLFPCLHWSKWQASWI